MDLKQSLFALSSAIGPSGMERPAAEVWKEL